MGCVCSNNINDKYALENIINNEYENITKINSNLKITNYVKKVFYLINKIRTNPAKFADFVISSQIYIKEIEDRIIFDHKIKVALNEGKKMFLECADYLRKLSPMEELTFSDDIKLSTTPIKMKCTIEESISYDMTVTLRGAPIIKIN